MLLAQVTEGHGLTPANLGNEHFSLDNDIETSSSQHETNVDNAFAILDSDLQTDEQQLLESNSVDEGS